MRYQRIRDLREDNDLTQSEIAKKLGIKRSTYAMWELGDTNFPIEKLILVAKIYRTNVEYLLSLNYNKSEVSYDEDINQKTIANNLKKIRTRLGKTQKEFAIVLNIRQSSYSYYEDGQIRIPTDKLVKLATTYNFSINEICGCNDTKKNELYYLFR